jgi:hypothetical protein
MDVGFYPCPIVIHFHSPISGSRMHKHDYHHSKCRINPIDTLMQNTGPLLGKMIVERQPFG